LTLLRWFVEIPRQVVKRRLAKRHLVAGIESTDEAAERRVEANDLINGDLVAANLIEPDLLIHC
jgi:pantothenate kinase